MVVGDGKVTSAPGDRYRALTPEEAAKPGRSEMSHIYDKQTDKIIMAGELPGSAHIYKTGDGRVVIGFKTVRISVRDNHHSNSTVVLDVAADDERDEAKLAIGMIKQAKQALSGILGVVYDTALRGTHIRTLAREGLVTVAPITAAQNPGRQRSSSERVEKEGHLGAQSHTLPDGRECVREFAHYGGQVCEVIVDSAGRRHQESLGDPHLELRTGAKIQRLHVRYDVRCTRHQQTTGEVHTFPLRWNLSGSVKDRDVSDAFNVAENI